MPIQAPDLEIILFFLEHAYRIGLIRLAQGPGGPDVVEPVDTGPSGGPTRIDAESGTGSAGRLDTLWAGLATDI